MVTKHTSAVYRRLYFYARNLCRYFHDRPCVIIQPRNDATISVRIYINNLFVFWLYFIGKNNLSSIPWCFFTEAISCNKRKRHLFRPQIQIPGQLNLRYASIGNLYFLRTRFIRIPRNSSSYRFFITSLHNLSGRVINHHVLVSSVCEFQPVPVKRYRISFRALTWFLCADAHIRDFTLCIGQSVIPFLGDGHSPGRPAILEIVNSTSVVVVSAILRAARFAVCFLYFILSTGTPPRNILTILIIYVCSISHNHRPMSVHRHHHYTDHHRRRKRHPGSHLLKHTSVSHFILLRLFRRPPFHFFCSYFFFAVRSYLQYAKSS